MRKSLANKLGLEPNDLGRFANDPLTHARLRDDIKAGIELGIIGTPAYLIDGKIFQGQIPPEIIKKALQ